VLLSGEGRSTSLRYCTSASSLATRTSSGLSCFTSFSRLATRASSAAEEGGGDGREAGRADEGTGGGADVEEGENEGVATFAQVP
jgi:hypothetical protein